jgi:para-nitrobenzyl esterase
MALSACALQPGTVSAIIHAPDARPIVVQIVSGPVSGVSSASGQAFLGIPFAAPPVGAHRFDPPLAPTPWTTVRDATRPGAACIQVKFPGSAQQSEDCLNLNVYAPPAADPAHPIPVMVWIYGGGFEFGYNTQYDPSGLAERQHVIVVAPNYRLGAFSFLAHPALRGHGEGALAILDQQAALRWVHANIAAFGGNPNNVTLFGESAGGWSVCYQLTAPGARGLFNKAIIESGACTSPDSAISLQAAEAGGLALAAELGCSDPATAATCLRTIPARKLLKVKAARRGLLGVQSWSPAYGGDVLPLHPRDAFERGQFLAVPIIDGTNRNEGRLFLDVGRLTGKLWSQESYEKIIGDFYDEKTPQVLAEYAAEAKTHRGLAYADIVTDGIFACPAMTLNGLLRRKTSVYAYEFDDPHAVFNLPRTPFTPALKAYHSSEIAYVMQTRWALANPDKFDSDQRRLSDRMQSAWGAFAGDGVPTIAGEAWSADGEVPLQFSPSGDRSDSEFARVHHCAFWNGLGH